MFSKGDKVTFDSQTSEGVIAGRIIRLNAKTATVIADGSKIERGRAVQWRVAYCYLQAK
jgi:hypothetical protein